MSDENKDYTFGERELETLVTKIKNVVLEYLVANDIVDYSTIEDFMLNYGIIVREPSWFSDEWKHMSIEDALQYVIIEQKSIFSGSPKDKKETPILHLVDFKNNQENK